MTTQQLQLALEKKLGFSLNTSCRNNDRRQRFKQHQSMMTVKLGLDGFNNSPEGNHLGDGPLAFTSVNARRPHK
jgi:hypothetical protein